MRVMEDLREQIRRRVREKKQAYQRYNFERLQEEAFATFFDLAQEYTSVSNLYLICVAVLEEFFGLGSRLHVLKPGSEKLRLVCSSEQGLIEQPTERRHSLKLADAPYAVEDSWVFPIRGNLGLTQWIPFQSQNRVLGLLEIHPKDQVDEKCRFFLEKLANRIGYNLHQKLLIQQNIEHIKFINQLVADIEHNVISPNLYYKLFLLRLKKHLQAFKEIREGLREYILFSQDQDCDDNQDICKVYHALKAMDEAMEEEWGALNKHYEHTSLFLETLLRRDHFEKGTYVLRRQPCNFRTEILQPLLDRYQPLFAKQGISIDHRLDEIPDEEVTLFVDKGLISQVFDNLFSNALKYTEAVQDSRGKQIKTVSTDRKILKNHFGAGLHGVRFNFFSTGRPLEKSEADRVFDEGYRASNVAAIRGSGHGLHFVLNVVEIHGGRVGMEPRKYGNLFYFTLPLKEEVAVEV